MNMNWYKESLIKEAKLAKDVRRTNMLDWIALHGKMIDLLGIDYDLTKKSEKNMDPETKNKKSKADFEMHILGEAIQEVTDELNTEDDPNWIIPTEEQIKDWWICNYPDDLPKGISDSQLELVN